MTGEEAAKLLFWHFSRAAKFTSRPASQRYATRERFCGFYIWIFIIKITQKFRRLGLPLTIIFTCAAREPAHNMGCGPLKKKIVNHWHRGTDKNHTKIGHDIQVPGQELNLPPPPLPPPNNRHALPLEPACSVRSDAMQTKFAMECGASFRSAAAPITSQFYIYCSLTLLLLLPAGAEVRCWITSSHHNFERKVTCTVTALLTAVTL